MSGMPKSSKIFYNIEPKVINTELARLIGLNEAIVLQQIHYWVESNRKANKNFHEGRYWTYGAVSEYQNRDFPFWSFNTVKRTLAKLISLGFLVKGNFNKMKMDQTSWYSVDYEAVEVWVGRKAQSELIEGTNSSQTNNSNRADGEARIEPLQQLNVGQAIPKTKQEIKSQRLEQKTNTQDECEFLFEEFWRIYPRKEGKHQARKVWLKLNLNESLFGSIQTAIEHRKQTKEWLLENGRFIPHPAKWLEARRWEDEIELSRKYENILIDGKPVDPVQRKQLEYIEQKLLEREKFEEVAQNAKLTDIADGK